MPEFAEYSPGHERLEPLAGLVVREATHDDLEAVAEIGARREGVDVSVHREGLERAFGHPERELWVAVYEGRVVGFGRAILQRTPPGAPQNCIPEGWYLGGLVVDPAQRRHGVGLALTRRRIERLFEREARVFYYATAVNRPTIDLHARLGFREVTRDFWAPGASFTGGVGVLFELRREKYVAAR